MRTELNGTEQDATWWVVDTDTKPIFGIVNFNKLRLHLQRRPERDQNEVIRAIQPSVHNGENTISGT